MDHVHTVTVSRAFVTEATEYSLAEEIWKFESAFRSSDDVLT